MPGPGLCWQSWQRIFLSGGYTGFEFATGIPGTLGGAVTMNAGAYGGEMKQVIESVRAVSAGGEIRELSLEELELGYRTSRIQKESSLFCLCL
ncbi:MAG: FAD-binding protein [Frisingicoccus sp.]